MFSYQSSRGPEPWPLLDWGFIFQRSFLDSRVLDIAACARHPEVVVANFYMKGVGLRVLGSSQGSTGGRGQLTPSFATCRSSLPSAVEPSFAFPPERRVLFAPWLSTGIRRFAEDNSARVGHAAVMPPTQSSSFSFARWCCPFISCCRSWTLHCDWWRCRRGGTACPLMIGRFRVSCCQDADGPETRVDVDMNGKLKPCENVAIQILDLKS